MNRATEASSQTITRRTLLAGAGAAAIASRLPRTASAGDKTLRLLCWAGYDNGDAARAFVEATGYTIKADYIGANDEIFLKLRAGGLGHYDLVTPANGVIAALVGDNLIQPLDAARLTSTAQCFPQFQKPAWSVVNNQFYAAPYVWGTVPMIYASQKIEAPAAWTDLLNDAYIGKIVLTNDSVSNIMIWNRALGAADPANVSTAQLNATIQVLLRIKREFAMTYTGDMNQVVDRLVNGKGVLSTTGWESLPTFGAASKSALKIARPDPGVFSFCDNLCLVRDAPSPDAAYAFIDHMRGADAQATLMNAMKRATVNAGAVSKLGPFARAAYDYAHLDQFVARNPFYGFPPLTLGDDGLASYVDWVNAWETVSSAKIGSLKPASATPTASLRWGNRMHD